MPGSLCGHAAQQFAGRVGVHAPHEVDVLYFQMAGADIETAESSGPADNDQGVEIGKAQGKGRAAAGVTFGVLVMVA